MLLLRRDQTMQKVKQTFTRQEAAAKLGQAKAREGRSAGTRKFCATNRGGRI
jgi:hypothetical protein